MTNEEAWNRIDSIIAKYEIDDEYVTIINDKDYDALRMARKILESQPCEDCISRTQALEMLGDEPENWTDTEKEIQEVNDYRWFKSILENLPSVTPQQTRRISVTERLPEEGQRVVVFTSGNYATVCLVKDNDGAAEEVSTQIWFYPESRCNDGYVEWMPLP